MKPIRTERLILRNWEDRDRDLFRRINSVARVMEFFPFRRDRAQSDAKMDELQADIDRDGFGFAAAEIAATGQCAGFAGLSPAHLPFLPAGVAFDGAGRLRQRRGASTAMDGLYFVGQPGLTRFASGVLRGVGHDAAGVVRQIARRLRA